LTRNIFECFADDFILQVASYIFEFEAEYWSIYVLSERHQKLDFDIF